MLTPGAWPILDHDDDPRDMISAHHVAAGGRPALPSVVVVAFLGSKVAAHAAAQQALAVHTVDIVTQRHTVYRLERGGLAVGLVEVPVGAPAAVIVADDLFLRGVQSVVAVGSCGALRPLGEGEFVVPVMALRDEGTSHHYLPPAQWVDTDPGVSAACRSAVEGRGHAAISARTWTTDALFRETPAMVERRRSQGCAVVEMECASLAACAQFRGTRFGQILFSADSLVEQRYDPRDWGRDVHEVALHMAVDAAFLVAGE